MFNKGEQVHSIYADVYKFHRDNYMQSDFSLIHQNMVEVSLRHKECPLVRQLLMAAVDHIRDRVER
ncbi:MAG: hypothetical protein FWC41_00020 [Firmicutes bacterium]|nr:hypothetical protein [Bacillota bacterium]